jgi:hypothetical protein
MDHELVAAALSAWGAWRRADDSGPRVLTTCGSAEWHYSPEAGDLFVDAGDREVREPEVPDHVAQRIERCVLAIGDPFRTAIVCYWVRKMPLDVIGRRLRVADPRQLLDQAHRRIAAQLA